MKHILRGISDTVTALVLFRTIPFQNFQKIAIKSWLSSYNCIKKTIKTIIFHIFVSQLKTYLTSTVLYPFDLYRLTIMACINCRWLNFIVYKVYPADNLYPDRKVSKLRWVCEIYGTISKRLERAISVTALRLAR